MGGILLFTHTYSWVYYDGDISHGRLLSKGLNEAPTSFSFLQVMAPAILLVLTRLKMPVSTSILLLSAFTTKASSIVSILQKSMFGYVIAFVTAIIVWLLVTDIFEKFKKSKPSAIWVPLQWISSGALWSVWLTQDMANIAVVLPRSLSLDHGVTSLLDRVGVALYDNEKIKILNGNQLASLIVYYSLINLDLNKLSKPPYVAKTIVTTRLIDEIANGFGVKSYSTLTCSCRPYYK